MKQDCIEQRGKIIESLGNSNFRVELDNGHTILCQLSGKMRKFYIRVCTGDSVKVEMSPYDLNRGRIVERENVPGTPPPFKPGQKKKRK